MDGSTENLSNYGPSQTQMADADIRPTEFGTQIARMLRNVEMLNELSQSLDHRLNVVLRPADDSAKRAEVPEKAVFNTLMGKSLDELNGRLEKIQDRMESTINRLEI